MVIIPDFKNVEPQALIGVLLKIGECFYAVNI